MKRKIVLFLLCASLLLPLALPASALTVKEAADVDGDGLVTIRDAAILSRYLAQWDGYVDHSGNLTYPWKTAPQYVKTFDPAHPVDLSGRTFRFLTCGGTANGTRGDGSQIFKYTQFSVIDVAPWRENDPTDDDQYAKYYANFSDVVAERNRYLEETYNCRIEEVRVATPQTTIRIDALSGAADYDVVRLNLANYYSQTTTGFLENLTGIPTLDLSAPWFDQDLNQSLTFENCQYYLTGEADASLYQAVFFSTIGLTNVKDSCGYSSHAGAADFLYGLILDGKWTIEKELEIVQTCYSAYNGSLDHCGVSAAADANMFHALGAGFSAVSGSGSQVTFNTSFAGCTNAAAWDALKALLAPSGGSLSRDISARNATVTGRGSRDVIYFTSSAWHFKESYTDNSSYYTVPLPFPKANEGEVYRTPTNLTYSYLFAVPVTARQAGDAVSLGFENGTDLVGYFLSAYFEASQNHTGKGWSLREEYVRELASKGAFHNSDFGGRPLEALQLIFDSIVIDRAALLAPSVYNVFTSASNDPAKWDAVPANYNEKVSTHNTNIGYVQEFMALGTA